MIVLGISDETHGSSVCLLKDGNPLFCASEERFKRLKNCGGFPSKTLEFLRNEYDLREVDVISVGGISQPIFYRIFDSLSLKVSPISFGNNIFSYLKDFVRTFSKSKIYYNKLSSYFLRGFSRLLLNAKLPDELKGKRIVFVPHHLAHASSACFFSGFKRCLCITADGEGDGESLTVNVFRNNSITKIYSESSLHSLGIFFAYITKFLGFKPFEQEGKVMGLAAYGNQENVKVKFPFYVDNGKMKCLFNTGLQSYFFIKKHLSKYRKEDIAAWVQSGLERVFVDFANFWIEYTDERNLALAGGIFSNVKLNKRLRELSSVKKIFVFPAMSDDGLSIGAAIYAYVKFSGESFKRRKLKNVFLGPKYERKEIEKIIDKYGLNYRRMSCEREIAKLLVKGEIIPIFQGKMEFGPRALGNRSVIMDPRRLDLKDELNLKLKQREWFMPFAPTILEEFADEYLLLDKKAEFSSKFMTMAYNCTDSGRKLLKAAIHIDGTCRPQILSKKDNERFYKIIEEFRKISGVGAVLNTSFNIHGEPIVCTPEDAIKTYLKAGFRYMVLEDYLIVGKGKNARKSVD